MRHIITYFYSLINVCNRFPDRAKWNHSGVQPTGPRVIYKTPRVGAHGGANGVVALLQQF